MKIQMTTSTSKSVQTQQIARSEFSIPTSIIFQVMTERQKTAFYRDAISFGKNPILVSRTPLHFKKNCTDFHSILLHREHHDSYLYYVQNETCD